MTPTRVSQRVMVLVTVLLTGLSWLVGFGLYRLARWLTGW